MKPAIRITALALLLTINTASIYASSIEDKRPLKERVSAMTPEEKKARGEEIKLRVAEIKAMDKSSLSREERKALKKELRTMNKEARAVQGVYLSVGAIIIIILLLILIL